MKKLLSLLNSRKFALYLMGILTAALAVSTFVPSEITLTPEQWETLRLEKPFAYRLASIFSTPHIVKNPVFVGLTVFLFLSTLSCTTTRVYRRARTRNPEFEKEKAFSFSMKEEAPAKQPEALRGAMLKSLRRRGWQCQVQDAEGDPDGDGTMVVAQKGMDMGFWGSVVFHLGLLICFLAVPISAMTVFRGKFVAPEGVTTPLREGLTWEEGRPLDTVPNVDITVRDLEGQYAFGLYDLDFRGTMQIGAEAHAFEVNKPVNYRGFQLSLHEFGYSTEVVVEKDGDVVFDYLLNLMHPGEGDSFDMIREGYKLFALFFPDFRREGNKLWTETRDAKNPVLLIKLYKGDKEEFKALLKPGGEAAEFGPYRISFKGYRDWAAFIVVREAGIFVLALGMAVGLVGLLVRFLSNERRLEAAVVPLGIGSTLSLSGYSRYYPAFLEQEVREMASRLVVMDDGERG